MIGLSDDEVLLFSQNEIYRHTFFVIGETLVEQSKGHIGDEEAFGRIRTALQKCRAAMREEEK